MTEEWISDDTVPSVPPDAKFREELHRALEQTHRQQMVQRQLGTRPAPGSDAVMWRLVVAAILIILILGIAGYLAERRRNSVAGSDG